VCELEISEQPWHARVVDRATIAAGLLCKRAG
jgi:hypothetical protein